MNNPIVVNPERNPDLASFLEDELGEFSPSYRMDRDNCGYINRELRTEIIRTGEAPSYVCGLYRVDSYRNWLDPDDFTDEELDRIKEAYGEKYTRKDLERYVDSLPEKERKQYLYIPHQFLILDGLVLDAASDMFGVENGEDRYYTSNMEPVSNLLDGKDIDN